ncbi:MAG: ABC transporter permease [Candidatus Bathyarchaeia archaeon]
MLHKCHGEEDSLLDPITEGITRAISLILSGDREVFTITALSLYISISATLLSCVWSIPISATLALRNFPGKRTMKGLFNAFIGIPTVALGLYLYLLLSRSGPLGYFGFLYTPYGIIIGQCVLVTPIIVSFTTSALESVDPDLRTLAKTLGASGMQIDAVVLREAFWGVVLAIIAAFNRAFAELGVAMMLGGNIRNLTRVLTTAIALETARGEIALSIALSFILLGIVMSLSIAINLAKGSS